jgi:hypothetical protein
MNRSYFLTCRNNFLTYRNYLICRLSASDCVCCFRFRAWLGTLNSPYHTVYFFLKFNAVSRRFLKCDHKNTYVYNKNNNNNNKGIFTLNGPSSAPTSSGPTASPLIRLVTSTSRMALPIRSASSARPATSFRPSDHRLRWPTPLVWPSIHRAISTRRTLGYQPE